MDNPTGPAWGPAPWIAILTAAAALGGIAWGILDHEPEDRLVAAVLVVVLAAVGTVLVRIRIRLRVVDGGILVVGPLRARYIAWSRIDGISTQQRGRFGRRGRTLELEVRAALPGRDDEVPAGATAEGAAAAAAAGGDDELLAFGWFDLGTDPARVGRVLQRHRAAGP